MLNTQYEITISDMEAGVFSYTNTTEGSGVTSVIYEFIEETID
jgi:hypothetical protein